MKLYVSPKDALDLALLPRHLSMQFGSALNIIWEALGDHFFVGGIGRLTHALAWFLGSVGPWAAIVVRARRMGWLVLSKFWMIWE